jgi:WD repeat and SOF domain-containing protein 1
MSLFGQTKRHTPTSKPRRSPLPIFTDGPEKKYSSSINSPSFAVGPSTSSRFFTILYIPFPRLPFSRSSASGSLSNGYLHSHSHRPKRYVRVWVPIPPRLYSRVSSPKRACILLLFVLGIIIFITGIKRKPGGGNTWSPPFTDPDTLVLTPEELAMIWEWEVLSGHHPSIHTREL